MLAQFALVFAMWSAMALAMMLPSAAPMILTYAEIADTALAKGEPVVSPVVLAGGYAAVWIAVSLAVAAVQTALLRAGLAGAAGMDLFGYGSVALFIAAGLYQFSAVKHACLRVCQRPFPFFFANWRTTAPGVFGLGLRQGAHCLGCCWAMMLLMFATGLMNAVWMAALGIVDGGGEAERDAALQPCRRRGSDRRRCRARGAARHGDWYGFGIWRALTGPAGVATV
ncbi:MAG: DUF2182 domain-containing protein [Pseudorhodoplanes sp.]|nr:DUF2182 domain-containing protein [Pseudorhodoplanes sp.]